jgi:hypothetical protein
MAQLDKREGENNTLDLQIEWWPAQPVHQATAWIDNREKQVLFFSPLSLVKSFNK